MSKYLIIGSCIAAIGAVEGIRSIDPEGRITVIDGEGRGAYTRPLISHYLLHPEQNSDVSFRSPDLLEKYGVEVLTGRAVNIDPAPREVGLDSGQTLPYEHLLIATGASPIIPGIKGVDLDWVSTFYSMDDAEKLNRNIQPGQTAVVIGSGLIGMKAAEALHKRGLQVIVAEREAHLLPLLLDAASAAMLQRRLQDMGITCICPAEASEITPEHTVILTDDRVLAADQIVIAAGSKPAVDLAVSCGLQVKRGIWVDENMRTSNEYIYAAGDVTETLNRLTGEIQNMALLPHAHRQGFVAGCNMAGGSLSYGGGIPVNSVKLAGFQICAAGSTLEGPVERLVWEENGSRLELHILGDKLAKYVAVNLPEIAGPLTCIIENDVAIAAEEWQSFIETRPSLEHIPGSYWRYLRGDGFDVVA